MIGRIDFADGGRRLALTLEDGGFSCPDAGVKRWADAWLRLYRRDYSPADGPFGAGLLHSLAAKLGGRAAVAPKPPPPPGTVY